ncbi:uncharacterized protein DFL_003497 [Arthrobotrys flagrans]|uniref:4-dimethylallyltryptophan N-methyltransferase n=1 Tax=Arthrobotrys flagrans TaxID=97331 RepID=A0A437A1Z4_ARTFL|nr:hypothetical protein DFL_003497 [Arthrobotrys flagrans]
MAKENQKELPNSTRLPEFGSIIDIGGTRCMPTITEELLLHEPAGRRVLSVVTLSDYHGLQLWSKLTHSPTYYQTSDEILLLKKYAAEISNFIVPGSVIVDIGSGGLRKVMPLLDEIEAREMTIFYFALDLCKEWLEESLKALTSRYTHVQCFALWGSFTDGLEWIKQFTGPKVYLSLGSTLCNNIIPVASKGLKLWADSMAPGDVMLLGYDSNLNEEKVRESYITSDGEFDNFIRHGMEHSNSLLKRDWYKPEDWELSREAEFQIEPPALVHRFVFRAQRDIKDEVLGLDFKQDERIICYESFKYPTNILRRQFSLAGLREKASWKSPASDIYEFLLVRD